MDHPVEPSVAEQPRKMTSRRITRSKFIESSSQPNFASSQSNTSEMASQQMLHNFTQCSTVNQSSANVVPLSHKRRQEVCHNDKLKCSSGCN
ncbi:UNVERIFIED_CONTAM: hypothetical protein Scaly_3057800 [Sesamum calycinum]|uniref:Uncharacterized protein n=1 Tax=Sesamum calycinum TaxID=2727403 RepID=A0AAW2K086_9LAMI